MRTTALCALGAIIVTPTLASGALIGLHLEQHAVVWPGTTTWRLYAEFDDPNDQLTKVSGSPASSGAIMSSVGFYQNGFGGSESVLINPFLYPMFPSLAYDSWVTIGAEDMIDNNMFSSGLDFTTFEAGGDFLIPNGDWGVPQNDPFAYGEVLTGLPNWHVLVGQFTTWGTGPSSAPWGKLNLSGWSTSFTPGGELVEWSVDGVTFGIPAPGALALLGLAGLSRRRRRTG